MVVCPKTEKNGCNSGFIYGHIFKHVILVMFFLNFVIFLTRYLKKDFCAKFDIDFCSTVLLFLKKICQFLYLSDRFVMIAYWLLQCRGVFFTTWR